MLWKFIQNPFEYYPKDSSKRKDFRSDSSLASGLRKVSFWVFFDFQWRGFKLSHETFSKILPLNKHRELGVNLIPKDFFNEDIFRSVDWKPLQFSFNREENPRRNLHDFQFRDFTPFYYLTFLMTYIDNYHIGILLMKNSKHLFPFSFSDNVTTKRGLTLTDPFYIKDVFIEILDVTNDKQPERWISKRGSEKGYPFHVGSRILMEKWLLLKIETKGHWCVKRPYWVQNFKWISNEQRAIRFNSEKKKVNKKNLRLF